MAMNEKSLIKVNFAKSVLNDKGIIFRELVNGQLKIDTVNFWATTEKWHDTKSGTKGQGINSFIRFLKENNII